jgi:hypothetical protein
MGVLAKVFDDRIDGGDDSWRVLDPSRNIFGFYCLGKHAFVTAPGKRFLEAAQLICITGVEGL